MAESLDASVAPSSLRAVTVPLGRDPVVDPLAVAGEDGVMFAAASGTLAGRGVAARLALPHGLADPDRLADVTDWLASVPHDDRRDPAARPGPTVTALGALPFDPAGPAELVVPELLFRADPDGGRWLTVTGTPEGVTGESPAALVARLAVVGDIATADGAPADRWGPGPRLTGVHATPPGPGYAAAVRAALIDIAGGAVEKVVLARSVVLTFDRRVDIEPVLRRLAEAEPTCTVFSMGTGDARFIGASPELLVRRVGPSVTALPLAGTVALDAADPAGERTRVDAFLASAKERIEHELVVSAIVEALRPLCPRVQVAKAPELVRLHTVAHLGTPIAATLSAAGRSPSALELVGHLHPTPAVGGVPRAAALARIAELEAFDRGRWAGPVGWVDAGGDGEWVIGIRSATVTDRSVRCLAGAGIVAGSDPGAELSETTVKLAPVVEAFDPEATARLAPTG